MSDKTVLTEEAIDELRDRFDFDGFVDQKTAKRAFARAIERAVLAASDERKDQMFDEWWYSEGRLIDASDKGIARQAWIAAGKAGEVKS